METMLGKLQAKVSTGSIRFLAAPYLPGGLIWAALLLAYTGWMVVLLGQPAGYWIDRQRAASQFPVLESLLSAGLPAVLLAGVLYLVVLGIALTVLTRSLALVLWLPASFLHLNQVLTWLLSRLAQKSVLPPVDDLAVDALCALALGLVLARGLLPRRNVHETASRIRPRLKPAVLGFWTLGLLVLVAAAALSPSGGWMELHPEHTPGRRAISAVAYDADRQRLVLFGGISDWIGSSFYYEHDTWEWDGTDWTEKKPVTSPPARAGHMMAYDEKRGVVVLFGGEDKAGTYFFNDTWTWDGETWTLHTPASYPAGRRGGQLFYDPQSEKVILTGGFYYAPGKVFTALNDAWAWDGEDWEYIPALSESLIITNPNVVYNPALGQPAMYNYKQLLGWRDNRWQEIDAGPMPPNRFGPWLAADPHSGQMLLFGGLENNQQRSDTWLFDGNTWQELHPDLTPSPRDAYVMFYDRARDSFIVYGGISTYALDDMWEYVLP
jgi:hypothetical protein